jgi:hypothetical protein
MVRLTKRRLEAISNALSAMLAGEDHQGDWGEDVSRADLEAAEDWVSQQLAKREKAGE